MKILVLNCGSSSLKLSLYSWIQQPKLIWSGELQWKNAFQEMSLASQDRVFHKIKASSLAEALPQLLQQLHDEQILPSIQKIDIVGHRIVHGGKEYRNSVRITPAVKEKIREFAQFAPLHNLSALQGIEAMEKLLPNHPQIAVFDTSFHHTLPPSAAIYPGPYHWFENKIQRYGFHGISYQYCSKKAAELLHQDIRSLKMVICHLGAGASLCAIQHGQSQDTTMGFTPLEGLMMNTRSGSIDPGIILERLKKTDVNGLTKELYQESGLLGISGVSSDMRDILKLSQQGHERAQLAFDMYIHRLSSCIGSMIAAIGGLDALVFTAGIGENTPLLRQKISERFAFLGLDLDLEKNEQTLAQDAVISRERSKVYVLVIHTQEALEIAQECRKMLS